MEILAEGQSDPEVLQEYRDRYLTSAGHCHRGDRASPSVRRVQEGHRPAGLARHDLRPDLLPQLVRHQKLDQRFANELVDRIIAYVKS